MASAAPSSHSLVELYDSAQMADPYPLYADLRRHSPVFWDDALNTWVVTRYDDIVALSTDDRLGEDRVQPFFDRLSPAKQNAICPLAGALTNMMLFNDRPRHTALRDLTGGALSRSATRLRRSRIQGRVDTLIEAARGRREIDVVADLSQPLTRDVIADLLGVAEADRHLMDDWASLLHEFFTQSVEQQDRLVALRQVFDDMVSARERAPGDDLVSVMLTHADAGDPQTREEMYANFLLVIDAGQVTTTYLIANAVKALLEQRPAWRTLRGHPELLPAAVHELMRFDSSVQFTTRIARSGFSFGGFTIAQDESVTLVLGSGNRDPQHFADPDVLDPRRDARAQLAFGHGRHFCLGAALGLVEIELAVGSLLRVLPHLRLADEELQWHDSINFRFLRRLPVLC